MKTKTDKSVRDNHIAIFAYCFVIFGAGFPMWWHVTKPYRASLSHMDDSVTEPIKIKSNVGIYTNDPERTKLLIMELAELFKDNEILQIKFIQIMLENSEKNIDASDTFEEKLTEKFNIQSGNFIFYEWKFIEEDVVVTSGRTAQINQFTSAKKIQEVLSLWIYQEPQLRSMLKKKRSVNNAYNRRVNSDQYDVLISILNPKSNIQKIQLNIKEIINVLQRFFVDESNLFSNITIKSQMKYQTYKNLPIKENIDTTQLGRHFVITEDRLPQFQTFIENKLGTIVSDKITIHLIIYVPPCDHSPLYINEKSKSHLNSFISPNWGGIIIENPDMDSCLELSKGDKQSIDINFNSTIISKKIINVLRSIFNIEVKTSIKNVKMLPLQTRATRLWETDTYIRFCSVSLTNAAIKCLVSLQLLLDDIPNIVITDEVGKAVNMANEYVNLAIKYIEENQLNESLNSAKKSFFAATSAFFDPTLLSLLYFPDEQKYAIYIPLFLPVLIPIVLSLKSLMLKKKSKDKDTITEDKPKNE